MKRNIKSVLVLAAIGFTTIGFGQDREYSLGLSVDRKRDSLIKLIDKPAGFGENLPKKVSLEDFVPSVGDQGQFGTCGGWATGYYVASIEWAIHTNTTTPEIISAYAYDPVYTYQQASDYPSGCQDGTYLDDLCDVLYENSTKRKYIDETSCGDNPSHSEENSLIDYTSYARLYDWWTTWEENTKAICQSLANNHPVLMGMQLPYSFFDVGEDGLFRPTQSEIDNFEVVGGHAMTIVGYDDDKFGGAFRVVNSWGDEWGDNGFCWITYEDFHWFAIAAYSFETELKKPDYVSFGDVYGGYGRTKVKKNGFFEGYLDYSGKPTKGIYINEKRKKMFGGAGYMKKLVNKNGGRLIYTKYNRKVPVAAIIY